MWTRVLAVALAFGLSASTVVAEGLWGKSYFSNLEVVDQDGRKLRFYDDVLKGNQVVISFIYTTCKEICPLNTSRLARVKDIVGKRDGLTFISISVDPENDTPEKLKAYAEAFGVGDNWLFLTGKADNLKTIAAKLGNREKFKELHRNEIILGNASTGEWARNSAFIEPERLAIDILQLDPVWRDQKRDNTKDSVNNTVQDIPDHPGEGLFRKLCFSCHTVGVGVRVGPDLRNVHERRSEEWLVNFMMTPEKMLTDKDPVALALNKEFPVAIMPSLGLTETDAHDLMAYLKASSQQIDVGIEPTGDSQAGHDHSKHSHAKQN
jgi:protein SCO1